MIAPSLLRWGDRVREAGRRGEGRIGIDSIGKGVGEAGRFVWVFVAIRLSCGWAGGWWK